jgi:hypothetical protein
MDFFPHERGRRKKIHKCKNWIPHSTSGGAAASLGNQVPADLGLFGRRRSFF